MASCDYKSCDLCGGKAFYDAIVEDPRYVATWCPETAKEWPPIGIAVLCSECNKTHEAVIRPRRAAQTEGGAP